MNNASSLGLQEALTTLRSAIDNPKQGLPEEVFLFVSSLTALVNVDLLIQDTGGRTLLTWRHDRLYGPGWHLPGGIVRFKEQIAHRISEVALLELGCTVSHDAKPKEITEMVNPARHERGHFVSLLFDCRLTSQPTMRQASDVQNAHPGEWAWHTGAPHSLITQHAVYRTQIDIPVPSTLTN